MTVETETAPDRTVVAAAGRGYEAIVIGAGHNALVTAAYLARSGKRTLVLERRGHVGGAAETSELGGVRVPRLADTVGRIRPSIVKDLDLRSHGLRLVAPDVRVFAPQPDGRAVTLWTDQARTVAGLRAWSGHDADAWPDFDRLVRSLGRFLAELAAETPPDIKAPRIGDALTGLKLGRTFRGLGRHDAHTILRVLPMAVADFVAEAFETDAVRAAVAWRGVRHSFLGPWSAGSTAILLGDGAGNDGGAAGQTVFAIGGPGALSEALASAARAAGAEIRCGAEVVAVVSRDNRVTGVALAAGEEIHAPIVVSGLDPKRTLVELSDPVTIGPSMRWRAGNYRTPGVVAKVNLVVDRLPQFNAAAGDDEQLLRGRILVAPGIDAIERAFDAAKYGRVSETPVLEATIPSLVDPSLVDGAPDGTHVVSVSAQYAPYRLRAGSWDDPGRADELGDRVVGVLDELAPGLASSVRAREVITPLDLERDYGLTGGHPLHGEQALDQFFLWRPFLGSGRYRLPIDGLYLCGSGAHPGGGITGQPGQNAAREILADMKRRR
ncbi:MAG TPA: NAD(P)/FAD-dependent oxidoreductase [Verrucomicrobiae bacterium]|jgi:phytoene dehydrogenase-like protein|nr:NAD(P)/FAD-dependent oxidoreductase [Verrucomicrobiae bacterium]